MKLDSVRSFASAVAARLPAFAPLAVAAGAALLIVTALPAATGDFVADALLGQVDFTHDGVNNPGAASLDSPNELAVDLSSTPNHLYVADGTNNRVLGWNDAAGFANGAAADVVIGQPDFHTISCNSGTAGGDVAGLGPDGLCTPDGLAVDSAGNLYVADTSNHRVLEYNQPFMQARSSGFVANGVFGQSGSFTLAACTHTATGLCFPQGLGLDTSDNLYIVDAGNHRVLEFNSPLGAAVGGAGDTTADMVLGQGTSGVNFTGNLCVTAGANPATASGMCSPAAVAVDAAGNVFVGDDGDARVLQFNQPLAPPNLPTGAGDVIADRVFGQGSAGNDFAAAACHDGLVGDPAPSADGICDSDALALDGAGDLFVTDFSNSRVLEYLDPLAGAGADPGVPGHPGDVTADVVFGQAGNFAVADCGGPPGSGIALDASVLCLPEGLALDTGGDVFITDEANSRVLRFNHPLGSPPTASAELGQVDMFHDGANGPTAAALAVPQGVAIDASGPGPRLYVADSGNNRVLGWNDAASFVNSDPADIVIGQPDANSIACNDSLTALGGRGADSLCGPTAVAVDSGGRLFVADTSNNRVLEYDNPFGAGMAAGLSADRVFGQLGNFLGGGCNLGGLGAAALCGPSGVAVDAGGNVYVSDQNNSRVLEFNQPLAPPNVLTGAGDTIADHVFGQSGSFASGQCNAGINLISPGTLCDPAGVAVDIAGDLFVADTSNSRVLEYNLPLAAPNIATGTGDTVADLVFGQDASGLSFATGACASAVAPPAPSATNICRPARVALDLAGNLFVADSFNNRVLEFNLPLGTFNAETGAGDATADRVFGQGAAGSDFVSASCADSLPGDPAPSATGMCRPTGVALDPVGNLYVADETNNRVVRFDDPLGPFNGPTPTPTATIAPTPSASATPTLTIAPTPSASATATATVVATPSVSATATASAVSTATHTATATATVSPSATATSTALATASSTPTATATSTGAVTPTATATSTHTPTPTSTATSSPTATSTNVATPTATPTSTGGATSTATHTATATATVSPSATATSTALATASSTPTATGTSTGVATSTPTSTATATSSASATATGTAVASATASPTPTATSTSTGVATSTPTSTHTPTPSTTPTSTATATATATQTAVASATATVTQTATASATATTTLTPSPTVTATPSPSPSPTISPTPTPGPTPVAVVLVIKPSSLKFAKVPFGHGPASSKPRHVTISNKSKTTPVTFTGIAASGDFSMSNGCGLTVAPKKKCRVNVTFTPTALGARAGTLTVHSNAINSSVGVPLSGLGVAPK